MGLGWLIAQLIARLDDYLIETTLTTVLAFGAYLLAERKPLPEASLTQFYRVACRHAGACRAAAP